MGVFNNINKYETIDIKDHIEIIKEHITGGMKFDSDNNFNAENKKIKNISDGIGDKDVVSKKWIEDHVTSKTDLSPYLKKGW